MESVEGDCFIFYQVNLLVGALGVYLPPVTVVDGDLPISTETVASKTDLDQHGVLYLIKRSSFHE